MANEDGNDFEIIFQAIISGDASGFYQAQGIVLGTRKSGGRESYLYMVNNLFAEIVYEKDNPRLKVESLVLLNGLNDLNSHRGKSPRSEGEKVRR